MVADAGANKVKAKEPTPEPQAPVALPQPELESEWEPEIELVYEPEIVLVKEETEHLPEESENIKFFNADDHITEETEYEPIIEVVENNVVK